MIIYQVLQIVRGTRAAHILVGILTVFIAYQIALRTGLEALRTLLASLAPYTAIAIIVLFQSEIRRTLISGRGASACSGVMRGRNRPMKFCSPWVRCRAIEPAV